MEVASPARHQPPWSPKSVPKGSSTRKGPLTGPPKRTSRRPTKKQESKGNMSDQPIHELRKNGIVELPGIYDRKTLDKWNDL